MSLDLERENARLERATPKERLAFAVDAFAPELLFTSSFGAGSGVLLHLWSEVARHLPVVFLDTGFLFDETLVYKNDIAERLGLTVEVVRPEIPTEDFLWKHGADIYLKDPDFCCKTNKVDPLAPRVAKARGWISGLRRDQSKARATTPVLLRSDEGPIKVHPLVDMTGDEAAAYMHAHGVPEHPLRAKRYLSIGCYPCTRPVADGEDERAGRWAGTAKTECGLHDHAKRGLVAQRPATSAGAPVPPPPPHVIRRRAIVSVLSRRSLLLAAGGALLASACKHGPGERGVLRFGVMANLTHAPALAGLASGRIARALGATRIETRGFRAGPRVVEALLGGAIDVATSGPAPIVTTHARHPKALRILAGVCSGGASLVAARALNVQSAADFRGKALATPQLGSTQDVALRKWLRANGLETTARGGDVTVHALASSDIRTQMMRGQLAGAWLPEPWATRVVGEGIATRMIDERALWRDRQFPTALLVARSEVVESRLDETRAIVAALKEEVRRAQADSAATEEEAYGAIKGLVSNAGPRPLFHDAVRFVDFTDDPLTSAIETFADDAYALGLVPKVACTPLFAPLRG